MCLLSKFKVLCSVVVCFFVQTINILIVHQSVTDMLASFFTLMIATVEVDGSRMSCDSSYDQFVCRAWLTRLPLWTTLTISTYAILITAVERYIAVIFPEWYNVRMIRHFNKLCRHCSAFTPLISITMIQKFRYNSYS